MKQMDGPPSTCHGMPASTCRRPGAPAAAERSGAANDVAGTCRGKWRPAELKLGKFYSPQDGLLLVYKLVYYGL